MTKSAFQIQDATVNLIGKAEQQIGSLKADNKANNDVANGHKIGAYCELIAALATVKLVKGNLPRAASKQVREALAVAGLKEATIKRYMENSVGAIRHFEIGGMANATATMVGEFFETHNIDSENKLAKLVKGEGGKSKAQRLAEQVVGKWSTKKDDKGNAVQGDVFKDGLDDAELEQFEDIMRELLAARTAYRNAEAAKAAEAAASEENKDVNDVIAQFAA